MNPVGTELPAGCEVLRFPGTTLLPGLIDMHVHLCCDSGPGALDRIPEFSDAELVTVIENALAAHLRSGVTTVRDLGDRDWVVIDWRDRHRESDFPMRSQWRRQWAMDQFVVDLGGSEPAGDTAVVFGHCPRAPA